MKLPWLVPLTLLILFEATADILSKQWQLNQTWWRWCLAIGMYIVANVFWLWALKDGSGLARGGLLFSVGSALLAILIGLVMYREQVGTRELWGLGLGVVSVILLVGGE